MGVNSPNIQWPQGVPYLDGDRGTMALGVKDISPFVPETLAGSENFEVDPISGAGTWTLTTTTPHTGLRCLRSAVIGSLGVTDYVFPVPVGATQIRFWWRVSSEATFDLFRVLVDAAIVFTQSGLTDVWAVATINVAGAATVTFRYSKDGSSSGGLDRALIDDIDWIAVPAVPAVENYEPFHLNTSDEVKVTTADLTVIEAELLAQTVLLTHMDGDLHDVNTELDSQTALLTTIETDLDAVNAELDAQTTILTHMDGDLHDIEALLAPGAGTWNNGGETAVGAAAVQVLAAGARREAFIQNTGLANVRVGITGVTATTGFRLVPNGHLILNTSSAVFAIREGLISSVVLAQAIT